MADKIISLCMQILKADGITKQLFRMADLKSGCFIPYIRNSNSEFTDIDRDIIHFPTDTNPFPDYTIHVYEWSAFQDERGKWCQRVTFCNQPWIELLSSNCSTPNEIVKKLKAGFKINTLFKNDHDVLIACKYDKQAAQSVQAVLIPAESLIYDNQYLILKTDKDELAGYWIEQKHFISTCNRCYPDDERLYFDTSALGVGTFDVLVKSQHEIICEVLKTHFKDMETKDYLSRKERQDACKALSLTDESSVINEVIIRSKCPRQQAQDAVKEFMLSIHDQLIPPFEDHALLERLIDNNGNLINKLQSKVKANWEADHEKQIKEMKQQLSILEHDATNLTAENNASLSTLKELQKRQRQCEEKSKAYAKQEAAISSSIQAKLQHMQKDKAAALVDEAFLLPSIPMQISAPSKKDFALTYLSTPESALCPLENVQDVIAYLSAVLSPLISSDQKASALSLFLLSAAACKQNLIIAGSRALDIANSLACIVTGNPCAMLYLSDEAAVEPACDAITASDAGIICIQNALSSAHYNAYLNIIERFPSKQFIITTPHRENLIMEPISLFNEFLPVLTEFFIDEDESLNFFYSNSYPLLHNNLPSNIEQEKCKGSQFKWFEACYT